jgi:hypothetical protein
MYLTELCMYSVQLLPLCALLYSLTDVVTSLLGFSTSFVAAKSTIYPIEHSLVLVSLSTCLGTHSAFSLFSQI